MSTENKILFIHHGEVPGGAPTSLLQTILVLKKKQPEIEIAVACLNSSIAKLFLQHGHVRTLLIPSPLKELGKILIGWSPIFQKASFRILFREIPRIWRRYNQLKAIIQEEQPDLIHLNSATLFLPALVAKRLNIPCILHVRETFGGGDWNLRRILVAKWLVSLVDHVIAISEVEKQRMSAEDNDKVGVVYNFVDVKKFIPSKSSDEVRKELNIPDGCHVFITLGGAGPRKGLDELLKAFTHLPAEFHLIVAGSCPRLDATLDPKASFGLVLEEVLMSLKLRPFRFYRYDERLRRSFSQVNHPERFHFVGHRNDVPDLLNASDALIFAGTVPHFPRPVFESWLLKKPVVVFKMLGISNQVENGKTGWIVNMAEKDEMLETLVSVISDPKRAQKMGENGYEKARATFDAERNMQAVQDIYQRLLA